MSQKTNNRPLHDRSRHLNDNENQSLIQLIEREDGVVSAARFVSDGGWTIFGNHLLLGRRFRRWPRLLFNSGYQGHLDTPNGSKRTLELFVL